MSLPKGLYRVRDCENHFIELHSTLKKALKSGVLTNPNVYVSRLYRLYIKLLKNAKEMYQIYAELKKEITELEKHRRKLYNELAKRQKAVETRRLAAYFSPEEEKELHEELRKKQAKLYHMEKDLKKQEQEYLIKQEELEIAIRDTNLAKTSYYYLTDAEIELFEQQRPMILEGIEKYGSINLAIKNNPKITVKASSIQHYAQKHRQFGEDIEIAKRVFRDSVDGTMIDRAINGTVNPVFQRGEYVGDYAIKDNRLLIELAKAKVPDQYNPRIYAQSNVQGPGGTTINILSFDGVDETKKGYARNIGVVTSVDDTGKVERITQTKQMVDFYKEKQKKQRKAKKDNPDSTPDTKIEIIENGTALMPQEEILEAEVISNTYSEKEEG